MHNLQVCHASRAIVTCSRLISHHAEVVGTPRVTGEIESEVDLGEFHNSQVAVSVAELAHIELLCIIYAHVSYQSG